MKLLGYLFALLLWALSAVAQSNSPTQSLQPRSAKPLISTNEISASNTVVDPLRIEGNDYYDAEQYELAIKAFSRLLAKNTNDSAAAWQLASSYYMNDDMEQAAQAYARYVKLRPEVFEGHLWLGICLSRSEEFEKAEPELREAVRLRRKDASAHEELAYCLKSLRRYTEAGVEFERAIKYGGETAYRCSEGGYSYAKANDFAAAVSLLERGATLGKTNVYTYDWLGWSYYHTRDYEKAATTFVKSLELKPDRFFPEYWLGYSYLMDGKYERAADAFEKASKSEPDDEWLHRVYASVLLRCDRAADAVKALEPFGTSTNKVVRFTLFTAYVMDGKYKKASALYPVASTVGAILLSLVFIAGSTLLLYLSFKPSTAEYPHLAFAIGWLLLFFESQVALILFARLFTSANLLGGLFLAPIPLVVAAFGAFPKQLWGQSFRPAPIRWKQIGKAFGGWIAIGMIGGVYTTIVTHLTHHTPQPRNIRFVMNLVHEHRVWAGIIVALIAPLTEEILFRGLLYGALCKWLKPRWVILITSAIFAAFHMDLIFFVPLFFIGMLLGWARYSANSIWFSIGIHVFQNAIAFTALTMQ